MTNSHIKIIICNLGIIYLMNKSLLKQIKIKDNTLSDILFNEDIRKENMFIFYTTIMIIAFLLTFIERKIGMLMNDF